MAPIAFSILAISAFYFGGATAASHCYVCTGPSDQHCADVFDVTAGKSYACSGLNYGSNDVLPRVLTDIVGEERATNVTQYFCIKLNLVYTNGTEGISRSCFPQPTSIANTCEFIQKEIKGATVSQCDFCDDKDCNSGSGLNISMLLIAFTLAIKWVR